MKVLLGLKDGAKTFCFEMQVWILLLRKARLIPGFFVFLGEYLKLEQKNTGGQEGVFHLLVVIAYIIFMYIRQKYIF